MPLVALAFFFFSTWAAVLTLIWAAAPQSCPLNQPLACVGAFRGLEDRP
jgi:hypothetical protein